MRYTDRVGARVYAVRDADKDNVYLFGHGVYAGDFQIPGTTAYTSFDQLDIDDDEFQRHVERSKQLQEQFPLPTWEVWSGNNGVYLREHDGMTDDQIRARYDERAAFRALPIEEQTRRFLVDASNDMHLNPRIDLDNGDVVWGYQCWWGPEDKFDEMARGRVTIIVSVP